MATKMKMMKMLQEMHAFSQLSRLQSPRKPTPLLLLQLRSHLAETTRPRRRLIVSIDLNASHDLPEPVRITHLKGPDAICD